MKLLREWNVFRYVDSGYIYTHLYYIAPVIVYIQKTHVAILKIIILTYYFREKILI